MQNITQTDGTKLKFGLEPKTLIALVIALLFFIFSGFIASQNLRNLRNDSEKIFHSHDVIVAMDSLLAAMLNAETGQRGYLLSGEDHYLDPYRQAATEVELQLDKIEELTRDNRAQQARIFPLRRSIDAKMAELEEVITTFDNKGLQDALKIIQSGHGKQEMEAVRAQLKVLHNEEQRLREERLLAMDSAYRSAWISGIMSCLLGLGLTIAIGILIRRSTLTSYREKWLQSGQVELSASLLGDLSTGELGDKLLEFLAQFTGAKAGALFVSEHADFKRVATYGVPAEVVLVERFQPKEGLLGQVAADGQMQLLDDVPDGYLRLGSSLGSSKPRYLTITPATADGQVEGVLELGFLHPVDEATMTFLKEMSLAVGMALRSARYRAQLQSHTEELQVQSEELRVSNEELEEQGRALKESQASLEQQQVELEQINSQLEEQARLLETQRDDLARSNSAVELKARELEQASRYKSDFLANMSHELRTPLNSLLILSKLLGDNRHGNLNSEQIQYARTIESAGNDLLSLINDILDLSKIEAGHMQVRAERVEVDRLAADLRQTFEPIAASKGLDFAISIDPQSAPELETDRQRIVQILKNLLSNAFKFTEKGGVTLEVAPESDKHLALSVIDTGIGIPPEQQKAIFEAFRQADGTVSRKYGGTGLGLSISRELARLLGGSIRVSSVEGEGSRFTLLVPVTYHPNEVQPRDEAPAPVKAAPIKAPEPVPTASVRSAPQRHVDDDRDALNPNQRVLLVVEDDAIFAGIVRDIAREMGFQCLVTGTAENALELARSHKPHALVLDVGLPDQSGLALLDRLKRDVETRHIPVHVISGADHTQTALSLGAIGYLMKPVKREELAEVLDSLTAKLASDVRRVLIVEDDDVQRDAVGRLLATGGVETVGVSTAAECLEQLRNVTFDCMVLDLNLPDASGFTLLETLSREGIYAFPPVIVYTGHDLSPDDEQRLRRYSDSIIIKGARSPERLLDEVSLFLHQVVTELPDEQQSMIRQARNRDAILEGRRILIVEDDVRNVFSLTNILEPQGALVEIARNGQEALDALEAASADPAKTIDLVLMDVMMPVMDGLTATRAIRADARWSKLPVITLTAKAMPDDQERCIEAGANDYMAKPLDVDKLLSLVRVWMPR